MNFLKNKNIFYLLSDDNSCFLEANFNKSIQFNEPMECALQEIILPNKLFRSDQLKFLQITGEFEWLNNQSEHPQNKSLFKSIHKLDYKPQHLTKNFELNSSKNLNDSIQQIVGQINDWAKSIILEASPQIFTPEPLEKYLFGTQYDFENFFQPLDFGVIDNKLILKKSGKFDFYYKRNFDNSNVISNRNKRQIDISYELEPPNKLTKHLLSNDWGDVDFSEQLKKHPLFDRAFNKPNQQSENKINTEQLSQQEVQTQNINQNVQQQSNSQNSLQIEPQNSDQSAQQHPEPQNNDQSSQQQPEPKNNDQSAQQQHEAQNSDQSAQQQPETQNSEQIETKNIDQSVQLQTESQISQLKFEEIDYILETLAKFDIKFNNNLSNLLGISNINIDQVDQIELDKTIDFTEQKINYLFVYCDGIVDSYINERKRNLLKVISIKKNENSDMTIYKFEKPLFMPLRINEFDSLRITIKDEEDEDLFFTDGKLLATLILRPIRDY